MVPLLSVVVGIVSALVAFGFSRAIKRADKDVDDMGADIAAHDKRIAALEQWRAVLEDRDKRGE